VLDSDYSFEAGAEVTRSLLGRRWPPTAIIYDNDLMAVAGLGIARDLGFSRFSTTLTVSPYQRHDLIVAAGEAAAEVHGVDFVYLDARARFRESYAESRRLELYRQPYCGCAASKWEAWHERRARRRSA